MENITVIVPNAEEKLWPRSIWGSLPERAALLGSHIADLSLFQPIPHGYHRVIVVSAYCPPENFLKDVSCWLGYLPEVRTLRWGEGTLCQLFAQDACLVKELQQAGLVQLRFWAATPEALDLLAFLQKQSVNCTSPDLPQNAEGLRVILELDGKIGARQFYRAHPQLPSLIDVPFGEICQSDQEVWDTITRFQNCGAVVKAPRCDGNTGVLILRKDDLANVSITDIQQVLAVWDNPPWLVEAYIAPSATSSYPCFMGKILPAGQFDLIGIANQIVSPTGRYLGAEVGPTSLAPNVERQLCQVAQLIGKGVADLGYRGPIGFDAILSSSGRLVWGEINGRRIATEIAFNLAKILKPWFGQGLSFRSEGMEAPGLGYDEVRELLDPIWLRSNQEPEGVLITAAPAGKEGAFKIMAVSQQGIAACRTYCQKVALLLHPPLLSIPAHYV